MSRYGKIYRNKLTTAAAVERDIKKDKFRDAMLTDYEREIIAEKRKTIKNEIDRLG